MSNTSFLYMRLLKDKMSVDFLYRTLHTRVYDWLFDNDVRLFKGKDNWQRTVDALDALNFLKRHAQVSWWRRFKCRVREL